MDSSNTEPLRRRKRRNARSDSPDTYQNFHRETRVEPRKKPARTHRIQAIFRDEAALHADLDGGYYTDGDDDVVEPKGKRRPARKGPEPAATISTNKQGPKSSDKLHTNHGSGSLTSTRTAHGTTDNGSASTRSSILKLTSNVAALNLSSGNENRVVMLGLLIGYVQPVHPVSMSWRNIYTPSWLNPKLHNYGRNYAPDKPKNGTLWLGICNLQIDENLRLCYENYNVLHRPCRYLETVENGGVSSKVRCANNHGLTQKQLNEMFYGRRITLERAKHMVRCNENQPNPPPKFYVPLHVPVAPPGYDESSWVLPVLPSHFLYAMEQSGMDMRRFNIAPVDLAYAGEPEDPHPVHPAVKQSLAIFQGDPERLREEVEDNWEHVARLSSTLSAMGVRDKPVDTGPARSLPQGSG